MKTIKNIKLPDGETYKIGGGLDDKITNCITEIPQDIKLELKDGVLTLKAGSKVYVPNGFEADGTTPRFGEVVIESDINGSQAGTLSGIFYLVTPNRGGASSATSSNIYSGSTEPTGTTYAVWYDTANNRIGLRLTGSSTFTFGYSFPVCVGTIANNLVTSIDQIFNGFGYIGSTVFVTKGVKGLIPNGRNEDGTLNNIEFTTDKIIMDTGVYTSDYLLSENHLQPYFHLMYAEQPTKPTFQNGEWFNTEENILYRITNGVATQLKAFAIGKVVSTGIEGSVVSFNPKLPFRALDYSNKSEVASWSMPSGKYIDLTVGASGTNYTAPANGYVCIAFTANTSGVLYIYTNKIPRYGLSIPYNNGAWTEAMIPVQKGNPVTIQYTGNLTVNFFHFIYAEGEV